ncbi:MAG: hypothetical protein HY619_05250, partial [Thaumarchaeota archaeon]|nr:hypothetical protein [Nitrososphaerota archaeon]
MVERVGIVTGGTGALGRAVTEALIQSGTRVSIPFIVDEEVKLLKNKLHNS